MKSLLLGTTIENCVQEEDSKLGQLNYPLQRVILMKFMPNEEILLEICGKYMRNTQNK